MLPDTDEPGCVYSVSMKDDQQRFLALLGKVPARLLSEQVAWVLNCQPHDIPILVAHRLLKPLGNPPANGIKFFATADVVELSNDRAWLAKMTQTVTQHWQKKNAGKKVHTFPNSTVRNSSMAPEVETANAA
jgi:hypothetical protein